MYKIANYIPQKNKKSGIVTQVKMLIKYFSYRTDLLFDLSTISEYDLIHIHFHPKMLSPDLLNEVINSLNNFNIRKTITLHDTRQFNEFANIYRKFDGIIFTSNLMAIFFKGKFNIPNRIISLSIPDYTPKENPPPNKFCILTQGMQRDYKNLNLLKEVFLEFNSMNRNSELVILCPYSKKKSNKVVTENQITIDERGYNTKELLDYMNKSNVLVYYYKDIDYISSSGTIPFSMALNKIIISSNSNHFSQYKKYLITAKNDNDLLNFFVQAYKGKIEKISLHEARQEFSAENNCGKYQEFWNSVLAE